MKFNNSLYKQNWLLAGLGGLFLFIWMLPPLSILENVVLMSLPTHMFTEMFSIVVSMLVFAIVFSANKKEKLNSLFFLASAFFIVGMVDFAHTISYGGMPDFVTPGSPDKSIYFWLVARYVVAIALLITSLQQRIRIPFSANRYVLLFVSLALTGFIYWIGLYHLDVFPQTFIPGKGLTTFKIAAEYGIIIILIIPALLFYRNANQLSFKSQDVSGLYVATVITILSELCFTLYANTTGLFILMGHIYKVIAYFYIFRAVFVFVVREPYQLLSESEHYNRTLFESSSIGLALTNMNGMLIDINESFANIIGCNIEEAKQLSYWQITPEDYKDQEQIQLKNLETKKQYGPYEKEYIHKDGHRVPVRLSGKIIVKDGEPFIWSSIEDITDEVAADNARYESEQHFLQLADHIREVFWLSDIAKQKIIYISPAYEKIWGLSCESLYANPISFIEAIHDDDRERVIKAIQRQKEELYLEEYRVIQPDSTVRWVKEQSFPIKNKEGEIYRIAGVAEDITEEKLKNELLEQRVEERTETLRRKEEELITAKDEAERANLAKSEFLSSMSHELRTPLNAILGFSQLLSFDDNLTKEQKVGVNDIYQGGTHLLELINEVLDLAKIEASNFEIFPIRVNVSSILKECISLSAPLQSQYSVTLTNFTEDNMLSDVIADSTRIKQIILNLISNACKYNNKGGSIEIRSNKTSNGKVCISIKDTGKGIAQEQHDSIFEPFNRLGAEYSGIEGTGIGLTITKKLIEMMGGSIGFESELGQGSTFWIELPQYEGNSK